MFYSFALVIPANTPQSSPASLSCKLTAGTIERVDIQFPAGCAGLVHVSINHLLHQLAPNNPDGTFSSDGQTISFGEDYPLKAAPYAVTFKGWNDDDTFPHTITLWLSIRRPGIVPDWVKAILGKA